MTRLMGWSPDLIFYKSNPWGSIASSKLISSACICIYLSIDITREQKAHIKKKKGKGSENKEAKDKLWYREKRMRVSFWC